MEEISVNYKIEKATIEDLDAIHKLIYDRCLWFREKGVKGWNVNSYPHKYGKNYLIIKYVVLCF